MTPPEQERMQERMRDWVKLTPDQRRLARENYNRAKKLNAEQKARQWEEYQQLPDEKKKQLADTSPPPKRIVNPPRLSNGQSNGLSSAQNSSQVKTAPKVAVPAKQPVPRQEAIQPSLPPPTAVPATAPAVQSQ